MPEEPQGSPVTVRKPTRPDPEVRARWAWTEPTVWTDRMLTALEKGVKGGRWHSLIDKVARPGVLRAAFAQVKANRGAAGVDHQTVAMVQERLDATVQHLSKGLLAGTYAPQPVRRVWVPKVGRARQQRPLGIPTRGYRWPCAKSVGKLKDAVRSHTGRCNGQSLSTIITELTQTLRGWFVYFQHSHRTTFPGLDGWVRMRLRSILRHRHKGTGRGRGHDHWRWPNAYFAAHGLLSLTGAHALARQSRHG